MKKRLLIIISIIVVIGTAAAGLLLTRKKQAEDFNIILVSIDTLRADHLGCYKYPRPTSPAVDRLREDGVLFRRCMAQSASTLASHGSMLTSLILSHHGAFFTRSLPLPQELLTMAEFLKVNDYRTISFNDGGQIAPEFGLNQGFELYRSMNPKNKNTQLVFSKIVEKSIDWLDNHPGEKFFFFLHTYETHHPYTPDDRYLDLFESGYAGSLPKHIYVPLIKSINSGETVIDDADKQHIINTYDAEIRSMDDSFGKLIEYLKKSNLYDNTLIIFTSDHGEEFGEHGVWGMHSHTLFNEQLHVPLIVKFPRSKFAGRKVNPLVRSIDILPTVVDLLGEEKPGQFEGTSLMPFIRGRETGDNIYAISQRDMQKTYVNKYWSVMNRKWKLYDSKLYNLLDDPGELTDVGGLSKQNRKRKRELEGYAIRFLKQKKKRAEGKKVQMSEELKKKLETLGYIGK
ncbi:MAG: sulfatase [bacterium]|nr:sulfatase [bacterium]